jgi:outer membrane protein assembly factor BamB
LASTTSRWLGGLLFLLLLPSCFAPSSLDTGDPVIDRRERPYPDPLWIRDVGRAVEFSPVSLEDSWLVVVTDGAMLRVSREKGKTYWKRKLPAPPTDGPMVFQDVVVVATDVPRGRVVAYRLEDGKELWEWGEALTLPAGRDTVLVLSARGGAVIRLDPFTGREIWKRRVPGAGWRPPALRVAEELVLVPVRPDSVLALSVGDGERVWGQQVGSWPLVSIDEGPLVVATDDSVLSVLDPLQGDVEARLEMGAMSAGPPVERNGTVYVALRSGLLVALRTDDLSSIWRRRFEAPFVSPPHVRGGLLFQAGARGVVHMVDVWSGEPVGEYGHIEQVLAAPRTRAEEVAVGGERGTLIVYRREP